MYRTLVKRVDPNAVRHNCRWTEDEIRYLQWNWGPGDMRKVVKHLGRSHVSVEKKAVELKLGGVRRGIKTLHQLSRDTGYARSTLEIAASNIGLKFHRTFRGGKNPKDRPRDFAITFEQEEQIIAYLTATRHHKMCFRKDGLRSPAGEWGVGRKPAQCKRCKRTSKPHYAKGQCRPCYNTLIKQSDPRRDEQRRLRQQSMEQRQAERLRLREEKRLIRRRFIEEQRQMRIARLAEIQRQRAERKAERLRLREERLRILAEQRAERDRVRVAAREERERIREKKARLRAEKLAERLRRREEKARLAQERRIERLRIRAEKHQRREAAKAERLRLRAERRRAAKKKATAKRRTAKPSAPSRKRARTARDRSQRRAA